MGMMLDKIVAEARSVVATHPKNDLPLGYRRNVFAALGPRSHEPDPKHKTIGHTLRLQLATLSLKKVLSRWEKVLPADETPHRGLEFATKAFSGECSEEEAWSMRGQIWDHCDYLANERKDLQIILGVGYGVGQLIAVAVQDESFDPTVCDLALTEGNIDPDDLDVSYFAAAVFAGGTVWTEDANNRSRQEFWNWWLDSAAALKK
jgi:Immunity protein Imm5